MLGCFVFFCCEMQCCWLFLQTLHARMNYLFMCSLTCTVATHCTPLPSLCSVELPDVVYVRSGGHCLLRSCLRLPRTWAPFLGLRVRCTPTGGLNARASTPTSSLCEVHLHNVSWHQYICTKIFGGFGYKVLYVFTGESCKSWLATVK